MKRLHITGCPRSGTTLAMELMRACFHCDRYCEHEISVFRPAPQGCEVYFSKQPSDIKRIAPLLDADPNFFSLCMIRDPRSVISSIHDNFRDVYFCNYRVWNECYQAAKRLSGKPQFFLLKYEDLASSPDAAQEKIHRAFPWLVKRHDFSKYHEIAKPSKDAVAALGGVRAVATDRLGAWRKHLPRVKYECRRHPELSQVLIEEGYEKNDEWMDILSGVKPAKGKCRYPDRASFFKEVEYKLRTWMKVRRYVRMIREEQSQ